jgi:hypothetical protein
MKIPLLRHSTPWTEFTQMIFDRMGDPRAGSSAHLTPTKRRKRAVLNGDKLPFSLQGWRGVCKCLSTFMWSLCEDSLECTTTMWICHTKKGKLCFLTHLETCHGCLIIIRFEYSYFMTLTLHGLWWHWRRWSALVNVAELLCCRWYKEMFNGRRAKRTNMAIFK